VRQRNTATGRLTEAMLDAVFLRAPRQEPNGISRYWAGDVGSAKDQRVGARMSASQPKTTRGRTR
jgi:hypothetical protein